MRVLLVDDNADVTEIAAALLEALGHDCRTAASAAYRCAVIDHGIISTAVSELDLQVRHLNAMCVHMKAYGMGRQQGGDTMRGMRGHGVPRASTTAARPAPARAYRSLRGGKKAAARCHLKRAARREGKLASRCDGFDHASGKQ